MTTPRAGKATLMAIGDVGPHYDEPVEQVVEKVLPVLRQGDVRFAQCESVYSEEGAAEKRFPILSGMLPPRLASVYTAAGIDVVCLASNHTYDYREAGVLHNIKTFQKLGITVFGTGKNIQEARKPAIVERNGVRIAFLGYASAMNDPFGSPATEAKPGLAPIRVHTWYEPVELQAATPPRVMSLPYEEDIAAMVDDVRKAKQQADVVVMSIHWGIHLIPKVISMYQPRIAHAAIDAGVDVILGTHAHIPKAIEVYKGKVCFYSLSNFFNAKDWFDHMPPRGHRVGFADFYATTFGATPSIDGAKTCIAKITLSKKGVERVAFIPTFIESEGPIAYPVPLKAGDKRFGELLKYWEWVSDEFPHRFRVEGDEVVVEAP